MSWIIKFITFIFCVLLVASSWCLDVSSSYRYDLTSQLPSKGTFSAGTAGCYTVCSAGGSILSRPGSVQLTVSSTGGYSEINLLHGQPIDLAPVNFPVDLVGVLIRYEASNPVCPGGEFEVFVSGDTSAFRIPVRSSLVFGSEQSYLQSSDTTGSISFVLNVIPQDYTLLNELVLRYTTPGGVESYINLKQVLLWVERRHL